VDALWRPRWAGIDSAGFACAWELELETMAVQLVPDSALSLLMVSVLGGGGARQRPRQPALMGLGPPFCAAAADCRHVTHGSAASCRIF
jgi:hypothetical protein